ncbi:MAG: hypothetical protein ACRENE_05525, partial [Polyangiaceae bacterium]
MAGVDSFAAFGAAPDVVTGLDIWIAARRGAALLGFELRADSPDNAAFAQGGHANVLLLAASADPCAYIGPVFLCGLATVGWLHAAGSDVLVTRSGSALAAAFGPRMGFETPLGGSFALRVRGDFVVNALRPTVVLNGAQWTLPLLGGALGAGLA